MDLSVQPGTYVVAVSGGVDSMALLHVLAQQPDHRLIVAHFDHGIRSDSHLDRKLVQAVAQQHGLNFVYDEAKLGPGTSEEAARKARYEFLKQVQKAAKADAIITAHHHNDVLETAIINLLRGTNRRGLSSLRSRPGMLRPMLHIPKADLQAYAKDQGLVWREDSTNTDTTYMRNYVRHRLLNSFDDERRTELAKHIATIHAINHELDEQLMNYLHVQPATDRLDRREFIRLPHVVAREVMASWLRNNSIRTFDSKMLERLVAASKTGRPGKQIDIVNKYRLQVARDHLALTHHDR